MFVMDMIIKDYSLEDGILVMLRLITALDFENQEWPIGILGFIFIFVGATVKFFEDSSYYRTLGEAVTYSAGVIVANVAALFAYYYFMPKPPKKFKQKGVKIKPKRYRPHEHTEIELQEIIEEAAKNDPEAERLTEYQAEVKYYDVQFSAYEDYLADIAAQNEENEKADTYKEYEAKVKHYTDVRLGLQIAANLFIAVVMIIFSDY